MENIILGLLLLKPRSIYELRKRIEQGLNLMYSCSTGSIQAALKKLLKNGCIEVNEIESGKHKKNYSITKKGKMAFSDWLNASIDVSGKNPELAKIYFFGFAKCEDRIRLIENHILDLKKLYAELSEICEEGESMGIDNEILFYQLQTAKYGRDAVLFNINWYGELLQNIKDCAEKEKV